VDSAWDIKVFQRHRDDDPDESCPAETFLLACPQSVREDLIEIVDAVAAAPPPRFPGGGMWVERGAPGLDGPSVIVIGGLSKTGGDCLVRSRLRRDSAPGRRVPTMLATQRPVKPTWPRPELLRERAELDGGPGVLPFRERALRG
jgi:hypothetical protein